ncbi:MAG: ABC transporter ATP-binding protein [Acidimicrobiia bacterium]|nr:ABC transporter ATP-binding protein [Acidimicrobiia bacterium]
MITIDHLTKRYRSVAVVDDVSLTVEPGETVALWGPNGAGKTTIVRSLLGLLSYEGSITVAGLDVRDHGKAVRRIMGYVPQELSFFDDLTVVETLDFSASLRRIADERVEAVIRLVGLDGHTGKRVGELSGGLKQRLGIALALLPDPRVLLLDEPTSNLDAASREVAVRLLHDLQTPERVMVVTSHHLEEVGMLADRVVALDDGRVLHECPPAELADRLGLRAWLHVVLDPRHRDPAAALLRSRGFEARRNGFGVLVEVSAQGKGRALGVLHDEGFAIEDVEVWR